MRTIALIFFTFMTSLAFGVTCKIGLTTSPYAAHLQPREDLLKTLQTSRIESLQKIDDLIMNSYEASESAKPKIISEIKRLDLILGRILEEIKVNAMSLAKSLHPFKDDQIKEGFVYQITSLSNVSYQRVGSAQFQILNLAVGSPHPVEFSESLPRQFSGGPRIADRVIIEVPLVQIQGRVTRNGKGHLILNSRGLRNISEGVQIYSYP
jgi:hypothetical protein